MAEGARLESVCAGNRTVGSNPTLSATLSCFVGLEPCALRSREPRQAREGATVSGPPQVPQVTLSPIMAGAEPISARPRPSTAVGPGF